MSQSTLATDAGSGRSQDGRVLWIDYAKGWSILMVVAMHSTLGVGDAVGSSGWLHELVAFAKPFRMPDFFVVAGLFAPRVLQGSWRRFTDRKILHFAYFYALWLFVELLMKARELGIDSPLPFLGAYLFGFVQPFSSIWFIQLLPILFLLARVTRSVHPGIVLAVAGAAHLAAAFFPDGGVYYMGSQATASITVNSLALYSIYFLVGVIFSERTFAFARAVRAQPLLALMALTGWACFEEVSVLLGLPQIPGVTLLFGLVGAYAVIGASVLLDRAKALRFLAFIGRRSLVIYLSFFVPMVIARILLLKTGVIRDVGLMSLVTTIVAIVGPLIAARLVRGTPLAFVYTRPAWAHLRENERPSGAKPVTETPEPRLARAN